MASTASRTSPTRERPEARFAGLTRLTPAAAGTAAVLALPGALTVYAAFQSGGFFAGTPALLAVVVGVALVLRATLAEDPFAGLGAALALTCGALGLFAVWVLLSSVWSDASGRALLEFDRVLLYWLVIVVCGSLVGSRATLAWAMRGVALGIVVVGAAALASRLFPGLFDLPSEISDERLNWPLTYWNALGLLCALGMVLCTHYVASEREPVPLRVVGAAALPVLATTILFTFSRGSIVVAVLGIGLYLAVARPWGAVAGALAAGPAVAIAVASGYGAELLSGDTPASPAAAAQGEELALVIAACALGAGLVRALLLPLDRRLAATRVSGRVRTHGYAAAGGLAIVAIAIAFAAFGAGERISELVSGFSADTENTTGDVRNRLFDASNNGRLDQWEVALEAFGDRPVLGIGAGTFGLRWLGERETPLKVEDAHSLYLDTLAELGVVGMVLLAIALGTMLVGVALRARGEQRHLYAALFAAGVAWAVHAAIDWDWEMPAVTAWLFGLCGFALARRSRSGPQPATGRFARVVVGVGLLVLIVLPGLVALSQRQLNASVASFEDGDCAAAIDSALAAAGAAPPRAEPFQLLGFCDARLGEDELAIDMLEAAIARDPDNWENHYGLAIVQAAAGSDPREAAAEALSLNPRSPLARKLVESFDTDDPRQWERRARAARLPIS